MCCTEPLGVDLPDEVAAMLLQYRHLSEVDPHGLWGDRANLWARTVFHRCSFLPEHRRFELWQHVLADPHSDTDNFRPGTQPTWVDTPAFPAWVRETLREDGRPDELSIVGISSDAVVTLLPASPVWLLPDDTCDRYVLIDSAFGENLTVGIADETVEVLPSGAALSAVRVTAEASEVAITLLGQVHLLRLGDPAEPTELRLRGGGWQRWSVVDNRGTARFPAGVPRKWDYHGWPFFHGNEVLVEVPAAPVHVRAARGLEYRRAEAIVTAGPERENVVDLSPERRIDPAARDWYGADFHVHMNYGSELVISPADAAAMQYGEGLHFMNLVAANEATSLIYDREALEAWPDQDLPWSREQLLARMGVEYRNDLLGHFHATGLTAPPSGYHTGHAGSDADEDWPPNSVALEEFRELSAVTGYCHPVRDALDDDSPPDAVFTRVRSVECRELVADAALGLVDSMDVVSNLNDQGAAVVYRRLLGAGIPLAATVGTDSMLSVAHAKPFSNPPGWARAYVKLDGALTVDNLKAAIRAGRTIATNGPWLELSVDGHEPGARPDVQPGQRIRVHARVKGPGVDRLRLYSADGVLAEVPVAADHAELDTVLTATEPTYVVGVADGVGHPDILTGSVMAHTSPVYIDVDGRRVARAEHARWCLDWLTQLETLAIDHGVFHEPGHRDDLLTVIANARRYYENVIDR